MPKKKRFATFAAKGSLYASLASSTIGGLVSLIGQSSPLPFFVCGTVFFIIHSLAWGHLRDLKWRLRHWTAAEVVTAIRAESGSPPQADLAAVADLIQLLADPAASLDESNTADPYRQMIATLRALNAGQPHQVLHLSGNLDAALNSGLVGRVSWDGELVFVFQTHAEIMIGGLAPDRLQRLRGLRFAPHPLVSLTARWALAHHHLANGETDQAQGLFAALKEAAPGLPVLHRRIGDAPDAATAAIPP